MINIMFSSILLDLKKIGTRVLDFKALAHLAERAIDAPVHLVEREEGAAKGHFILNLKNEYLDRAKEIVSCGDGKHTNNPDDYVIRKHWSGKVMLCLKREFAAPAKVVKLVIQTDEAYLRDKDVIADPAEQMRVRAGQNGEPITHVVVWVVASASDGVMPGGTLLRNLAGYNEDAMLWSADEIRARAKAIFESEQIWATVAD